MNQKKVRIYTDGACSGNPGPGGWGAILRFGGVEKELSGFDPKTTNNRMELMAVIEALTALKRSCQVEVFSDSSYVIKGMTEWLPNWQRRNWQRKSGKLENIELWQKLAAIAEEHTVSWNWVKGHAGHPENERADKLATDAIVNRK